ETVNAIAGELLLPAGVEVSEIQTGASAVLFWLEPPAFNVQTRTLSFSGLTPGGMYGRRQILNFLLKAKEAGTLPLSFMNLSAYKNDGKGTPVTIAAES